MNVLFHPEAEREFYEAFDYYEGCQEGLGLEFAKEIYATIQRIIHYPGNSDTGYKERRVWA